MKTEDQSADMWYMNYNDMTAVISEEQSLRNYIPKQIRNDASVKVTRVGSYQLTASQRATLDRLHSGWARKVLYGSTKHQRDLYVLKIAKAIVDPLIRKSWIRFHRDARMTLVKLIREAGNDDAQILVKLANFRGEIDATRSWWHRNIGSRYGSDPGLGAKLIKDRWERAWNDSKSFLNCTRMWGRR
jgi:hypothetical protein